MTITNTLNSVIFLGNGATTIFPYSFKIPDAASAVVILVSIATWAPVVLTAEEYSITGLGSDTGGDVTYPLSGAPIGADYKLFIARQVPHTQTTEVTNQTAYYASVAMEVWDRLTMMVQDIGNDKRKAIVIPTFDTASTKLPYVRANSYLYFDAVRNVTVKSAVTVTERPAGTFETVAAVLGDVEKTYIEGMAGTVVEGDYFTTLEEHFSYKVAASAATDHHVTTAGGVKLYVLAGQGGRYSATAFGVVGDGSIDDTVAFVKARATAAGKPLVIDGIVLLTLQQTITAKEHWVFTGSPGNASGSLPTSYLKKDASVSGPLVTINGSNTRIDNGGIIGVSGNTGDGYVINGNGVVMNLPYVQGCGQDGIRVGADVSGNNTNSVLLNRPSSKANGRHGIHLSDGAAGLPSSGNTGTIIAPSTSNNGSHGIYIDYSAWWTIINPLCQANAGYGIYINGVGSNNTIVGGDTELNTTGDLFQVDPKSTQIYNLTIGGKSYRTDMSYAYIAPSLANVSLIANNNFADSSIWELAGGATISGGLLNLPTTASGKQNFRTVVGSSYTVSVTIAGAGSRMIIRAGTTSGGSDYVNFGYITTTGTFYCTFTATTQNAWLTLFHDTGGTGTATISLADVKGNVVSGVSILSAAPLSGIGYAAGAGGAVIQTTSKATGVTNAKVCGSITMDAASLAANTTVSFVLTMTGANLSAADQLILSHTSGGTFGAYTLNARRASENTVIIDVRNVSAGALAEAIVLQYSLFRSVAT